MDTANNQYYAKGSGFLKQSHGSASKNRAIKKQISGKLTSSGLKKFGLAKKSQQNASQSLMSDITMTSR